jgi:uncharacterized protein
MALTPTLRQVPQRLLMALVRGYRLFFKAWVGGACRFEPSCSAYALQALERHGAARGSWLAGGRLLRCHPYCNGGHDPVPQNFKNPAAGLFSRLGLRSADAAKAERPPIRTLP